MIVRVDLGCDHEILCLAWTSRASCANMGRCLFLSIIAILMLFKTSQARDPNPWGPNTQETVHGVKRKARFLKNTKAKGCKSGKSTKQGDTGCEDPVWPVGPSWGNFAPTFTPSTSDSLWTKDPSEPVAYPPSAAPTSFLTTAPSAIPTPLSVYPPTTGAEDTAQPWPAPGSTGKPTPLPFNAPTFGAEDTAQPWQEPGSTVKPTPLPVNPPEHTAQPWPEPGSTVQPTPIPVNPPTGGAEDTAQPRPTPGSTVKPTLLPINPPTRGAEDTAQPWLMPNSTGNPTPSPMNPLPTTSPAASTTRSPTASSTTSPTSSPAGYPTASPTASPGGVVKPTTGSPGTSQPTPPSPSGSAGQTASPIIPTITGGDEDSGQPSPSPQVIPTPSPSTKTHDPTNQHPEDSNVETQGSVEEESGLVSSCKEGPPSDGPSIVTTTVKYEYVALMTKGAKVIQVLASVEEGTHKTFTSELLICDFTRRSLEGNYSYTAVYSIPLDEWNPDKACVDAPENQDCYIVNGGATFKHLSGTSESALLDQVGGILTDNYDGGLLDDVHEDLLGLDFVSFVEETISGNDTSGNDDPAGGDGDDGANKSASSVSIGGTAAITIAAIGLVVVGLLFFRRRRTQSMYVEEFGDKGLNDTMLDDAYLPEDSSTHRAPMVTILNDELDGESTYLHLERSYDLAQFDQKMAHDPVTCNSVTCAICRKPDIALQPIFVDTGVDLALSDTGELRPEMLSLGSSERIYTVPDTVEL